MKISAKASRRDDEFVGFTSQTQKTRKKDDKMFVRRKEYLTFAAKNQKKTVFMAFQASFYFYGFYFYFAKKAERDAVCQTKTI